jgi:5,10-methylenetetrahydromethanopterin reductase
MKIGLFGNSGASLDDAVEEAVEAAADGFASYWLPQVMGIDAMTVLALAGARTDSIELATAVLPIQIRHPFAVASQALTTQAACAGRFTLGLGLSHQMVTAGMWGIPFDRPASRMLEYLDATLPLLAGEQTDFAGDTVTSRGAVGVEVSSPPPVLLAALGPRMLQLAASRTQGTITWCTGPKTLAGYVVPTINEAAAAADRPTPRIVAGLPLAITDEPDKARATASKQFGFYASLPSYRAMLDREGVENPAGLALVGSEDEVGEALQGVAQSGVTDFSAATILTRDAEQRSRTREFLRGLRL